MASTTTYTFVVILPNARRANVKVSTNTTVLEVLEDVCKKHDLNPTEYDITHHNKIIDLGNTIRFSGLPNNATLEMAPSTKTRTESEVNLGLQLESGKRLMHSFSPQSSLWEVLEYWSGKGEAIHIPVVHQDSSSSTPSSQVVKPVCIYMRQEVVGEKALQEKTLRSLGLTKGSAIIRLVHRSESQLKTQANISAPLSRPAVAAVQEEKKKIIPQTTTPTSFLQSKSTKIPLDKSEPMEVSEHEQQKQQQHQNSFSKNDKPKITEPEEPTKLTTFNPPEISNAARFSKKGELHVIGPHDAILYHGDDVLIDSKNDSLDDSFFELSVNEVKKMYMELQKRRQDMENTPLTTKSTKELEKDTNTLRMLHDYPVTIVRIRFVDRYILQGCFRTADKLEGVHSWLTGLLANPRLNFYLFTAPPKKVLERDSTLVEQDLVGMAVLYFGSSEDQQNQVLKPDLYKKVSAPDAVYEFVHKKLRKPDPTPTATSNETSSSSPLPGTSSSIENNTIGENKRTRTPPPPQKQDPPKTDGTVPKWFKTGK